MYLEKFRLDGRVAFVTGGAQGIGLSIADRKLAEAIADRDADGAGAWMSAHFDESVGIMLKGAA